MPLLMFFSDCISLCLFLCIFLSYVRALPSFSVRTSLCISLCMSLSYVRTLPSRSGPLCLSLYVSLLCSDTPLLHTRTLYIDKMICSRDFVGFVREGEIGRERSWLITYSRTKLDKELRWVGSSVELSSDILSVKIICEQIDRYSQLSWIRWIWIEG